MQPQLASCFQIMLLLHTNMQIELNGKGQSTDCVVNEVNGRMKRGVERHSRWEGVVISANATLSPNSQ